jgi:hypothetical protein
VGLRRDRADQRLAVVAAQSDRAIGVFVSSVIVALLAALG